MTIRIGKLELLGVEHLHTEEVRTLVEQRIPARQGSVFQDMGREPVTIVLDGVLFGEDVLASLERLRLAQEEAQPLSFAADVAVGTEITEVLIEDVVVRQVAGYPDRFRFTIRLREHTETPESAAPAQAAVDEAVAADADTWAQDELATASALQDPAAIPAVLDANPGVLDQMSADELADAMEANAEALEGEAFAGIVQAVGARDPEKAGGMLESLKDKGALGGFVEKCAAGKVDLAEGLRGIDFKGAVKNLIAAFSSGAEFIRKAKEAAAAADRLLEQVRHFEPIAGLKPVE